MELNKKAKFVNHVFSQIFKSIYKTSIKEERKLEIGYVNIEKSDLDKRLNTYEPLIKEEKSTIRQKIEMWTISEANLKEGFEKWLKNIHNTTQLENKEKIFAYKTLDEDKGTWGEVEISIEEFCRMVLGGSSEIFSFNFKDGVLWISPEEKLKPISEKKVETLHIGENRGIVDNSMKLFECEFCKAQGRPMFFATFEDLKSHVRAFHGGYPDSKQDYVR